VSVKLERPTRYPGTLLDKRPTAAQPAVEPHDTPGFSIAHADTVTLQSCKVEWGAHPPEPYSYAVRAKDVIRLKVEKREGGPARPALGTISIPWKRLELARAEI